MGSITRHVTPDKGAYEATRVAELISVPSTSTSFGRRDKDEAEPTQDFVVTNIGDASATSVAASVPSGFTKTVDLAASIAGRASGTLTVKMDNTPIGLRSGDISITSSVTTVTVPVTGEVFDGKGIYGDLQLNQVGGGMY